MTTNTTEDIKSFVLLKYSILTSDSSTWHLCDTYPAEVTKAWAWRCAEDVEHLATTKESKEVYRVARLYRDGLATKAELNEAYSAAVTAPAAAFSGNIAAYYAYHAAYHAAYYAAYAAYHDVTEATEEKWKLYISWLVEELCKWESKHEQ